MKAECPFRGKFPSAGPRTPPCPSSRPRCWPRGCTGFTTCRPWPTSAPPRNSWASWGSSLKTASPWWWIPPASPAGGPLRNRPEDARVHPRAGASPDPLRRGPRLAPRRVRHRDPAHRPAPQGPRGPGGRNTRGARVRGRTVQAPDGAEVVFDLVTVGGTENLLMAAVLAQGETVLQTPQGNPRWWTSAVFSRRWGPTSRAWARTTRASAVCVNWAVRTTPASGTASRRATLAVAACITGGDILLQGAAHEHLEGFLGKLRQMGAGVDAEDEGLRVSCAEELAHSRRHDPALPRVSDGSSGPVPRPPHPVSRGGDRARDHLRKPLHARPRTGAHGCGHHGPGCRGRGSRPGAPHRRPGDGHRPPRLGVPCPGRASAAEGTTSVARIYHLDRGYERLVEKLSALGAPDYASAAGSGVRKMWGGGQGRTAPAPSPHPLRVN